MDGGVNGSTTTTATVVDETVDDFPPSPPHGPDFSPVGSPESDDVPLPPSDDDPDHLPAEDQPKDLELSSATPALTDDLKLKIMKQVEYYFSDENLLTDKYMMNLIKKKKEGFVPISVIASFRKMKKLTRDNKSIVAALRESSLLVVSSNGKKVKRLNPLPVAAEVKDSKLFTVLVENLPEDHSVENIRRIFAQAGNIRKIRICDPHTPEESKKGGKAEFMISNKLHALVEYETVEAAERAVVTLNNEQDWRNGMRVKLLKRAKYGQRKQGWRVDSERSNTGRASEPSADEENNNLSENQDDTHDEEDGDHLPKEKNGKKGRNHGQTRKQRYRRSNGLGHGTISSSYEAAKPPPGPRMPDGTRGFTMGRGRPPISI
ncbi:la-related protein 6A-like isoform X2 [Mangifera indica]|uniref:la-related protein 6A-like isoform X2 n=1 Tax=Mangifera indica TaxID=29780 RepID=UPI001CF9E25B|nr:la-related protein 6A-like isoform X2 [Mangifera indica]